VRSFQNKSARQVKLERDVLGVGGEIGIGCENLQAVPDRNGADQQVRPRALLASLPQTVIIAGGYFVVLCVRCATETL
jgi:hypothetical protein